MNQTAYIVIDPAIRKGKPCVKNTHISVDEVLNCLLAGETHKQIISRYPPLTEKSIIACIEFGR